MNNRARKRSLARHYRADRVVSYRILGGDDEARLDLLEQCRTFWRPQALLRVRAPVEVRYLRVNILNAPEPSPLAVVEQWSPVDPTDPFWIKFDFGEPRLAA